MLMADVFSIALSIVGFLAALQGLWLVCRAVWPGRFERAVRRCERGLGLPLLTGVVVTAVAVVFISVANALGGAGQALAITLFGIYLVYGGIGTAALATMLGNRLASPVDDLRPWRATVRGGVALELAFVLPIIGWFGLLPLAIVIGAGATTLTLWSRKPRPTVEGNGRADVAPLPPTVTAERRELMQV